MAPAIPTFPPTSSAELDQALNRFREELFVPFGLNLQQRKLMFRQKYADQLDEEPVTVNIGENDEPFQLRPMDPQSRPTKQEAVDAIALMKTSKDWQNLVPFLTGLRMSHRFLKPDRWEWIIRRANNADALGVVLECAKQSRNTGLRFNNAGVVQRFFFELHRKAQRAEFQDPAITKALGQANQALALMETPEHIEHNMQLDPKRKPAVVGVLLELHAAHALNVLGGKDEGGHVRKFVLRLLGTWANGDFNRDTSTWAKVDGQLQENTPIYNGLRMAAQLPEVAGDKTINPLLRERLNQMTMVIAKHKKMAPENVRKQPTQGLEQAQLLHQG